MNVAEALEASAAYIEEHGWCQHKQEDDAGRVCALGALLMIHDDNLMTYNYAPLRQLAYCVDSHWNTSAASCAASCVADWNDSAGRRAEDVTSTMRTAALLWRAKQQSIEPKLVEEAVEA